MKNTKNNHIVNTISSQIEIKRVPKAIWKNITDVQIEQFSDPLLFRLLDIPKPLSAEITTMGKGGKRIAYFNSGKKFIQEILTWKPYEAYSFTFNPEKGFRVGYIFDLSDGIFQLKQGDYKLITKKELTTLQLNTTYSVDRKFHWLLAWPIKIVLRIFQNYLLKSIKENAENEGH